MPKAILILAALCAACLAASLTLDDLCAERDAALAAGDRALARQLEYRIQDALLDRQRAPELAMPRLETGRGKTPAGGFDPDVLIANHDVYSFDTDYSMDGTMWAAFCTNDDSTAYVYKSTDNGSTWEYVTYASWAPKTKILDVGIVVGEGDSSFIHLFMHSEVSNGSCIDIRFDLTGSYVSNHAVFAREDYMGGFEVCRDYSGYNYWLYAFIDCLRDGWDFVMRSVDYGQTWAIVDSLSGWYYPHISASAGPHIYYAATTTWGGNNDLIASVNDNWGTPGHWNAWIIGRGSSEPRYAAIASDFRAASESATVWLAWSEDSTGNADDDILYAWTTDAGSNWNIGGVLAGGPGRQSFTDLCSYTSPGNLWMNLSYIDEDSFYLIHRRHCHAATPEDWSAPLFINTTEAIGGGKLKPRLTYSPGCPGTGAGCVFAGFPDWYIFWNAPWMTGVAGNPPPVPERPATPTVLSRARLLAEVVERGLTVFDASGRKLDDPAGVLPGVYYLKMDRANEDGASKVLVLR